MSKTERANCTAVMDALKAHGCIAGYSIAGNVVTPEWSEGGVSRVVKELRNPKPFGIKRNQRGWLLLLLPREEQERIHANFIRAVEERSRL